MDIHLLYSDSEFDKNNVFPDYMLDVEQDLGLESLYNIMAKGDEKIKNAVRRIILCPLEVEEKVIYRQEILMDCLEHEEEVHRLYDLIKEIIEKKQEMKWIYATSPSGCLSNSVMKMQTYHSYLVKLRESAETYIHILKSTGFQDLFSMLIEELNDEFLGDSKKLLEFLKFKNGMMIRMKLDKKNCCAEYQPVFSENKKQYLKWKLTPSYTLASEDMAGARDLGDRKDHAADLCVRTIENTVSCIEGFFEQLYFEMSFYTGALNLRKYLKEKQTEYCFPQIAEEKHIRKAENLKELNLVFSKSACVGNELNINGEKLTIITGANQGGKTVFLKSIGQAQIMMQCGLFVVAENYTSGLARGIFTHFKREEDQNLKSGKLDEELKRLNSIIQYLRKGSMILYNESFASTNEREGSELCLQITKALMESYIEQIHVTHLYSFSKRIYDEKWQDTYFLRAVRKENGERTYKMEEAGPLQSAFGKDLYIKIWESGDNE